MREILDRYGILIEPHGAVGIKGLSDYRTDSQDNTLAVTLETAHPAKFPGEVKTVTGIDPEPPRSLKEIEAKEEQMNQLDTDYEKFKEYLLAKLA
jgi:threonine synthase